MPVQTQPFRILNDPNNPATTDDIRVSYALQQKINAKLNETGKATKSIRDTRDQINAYLAGITDTAVAKGMRAEATPLLAKLDSMERRLYNPLIKSGEDNLRFPVQLEEKLAGLNAAVQSHDDRPTQGMQDVYADLSAKIDKELNALKELYRNELPRFNQKAGDQKRPAVKLEGY